MFNSKDWKLIYIPKALGNYKDVQIIFSNIPCKVDISGSKKKYPYNNFGFELYESLIGQKLSNYSLTKERIETDGVIKEEITLKNYRNITVEITVKNFDSEKTFYHDVGEAIIDAFINAGIKFE